MSGNYVLEDSSEFVVAYCNFSKSIIDPEIERRLDGVGFRLHNEESKALENSIEAKIDEHARKKERIAFVAVRRVLVFTLKIFLHMTHTTR